MRLLLHMEVFCSTDILSQQKNF